MSNERLIQLLAEAADQLNAAGYGYGWPGNQIALVAVNRWESYSRRHPSAKRVTDDERVLDLAKGLQVRFEPGVPHSAPSYWYDAAATLVEVFLQQFDR